MANKGKQQVLINKLNIQIELSNIILHHILTQLFLGWL